MSEIVNKIFNFVMSFQTIIFIFYIILNFDNLDNIPYSINILGTTYNFVINLYQATGVLAVIFTVITTAITVNGASGGNETSAGNIVKYSSILTILALYSLAMSYYLQFLAVIGSVIQVLIYIVYLLYYINV